ncbi:MAG: CBS domain-containing protein [Gammaproteobacteria bacterium]|nr:CBS domain-containing protein [Gammaproteobacteria bacterium]
MKNGELTQAFLSRHPENAARVLENLAAEEVAALFAELPVKLILPVIRRLTPATAAQILLHLTDDRQTALILQLGPRNAANILRNWSGEQRLRVFKTLTAYKSARLRVLLDYAPDSVGSVMDTEFITANLHQTVGDVEMAVRNMKIDHQYDIYIIDDNMRFCGTVSILTLLREDNQKKIRQIMDRNVPAIAATAKLHAVGIHAGWESRSTLPVVDRDQQVVGVFQLAMALEKPELNETSDTGYGYLASDILDIYWTGWKMIFGAILAKSQGSP